jgi:hypothetical protein
MLIILTAEVAAGVWAYINSDKLELFVKSNIKNTIDNEYGVVESRTEVIDLIQSKLECCGVRNMRQSLKNSMKHLKNIIFAPTLSIFIFHVIILADQIISFFITHKKKVDSARDWQTSVYSKKKNSGFVDLSIVSQQKQPTYIIQLPQSCCNRNVTKDICEQSRKNYTLNVSHADVKNINLVVCFDYVCNVKDR